MTEEFRVISGFPDFEISEFGRIREKVDNKLVCINKLNANGDLFIDLKRSYCDIKGNKVYFSKEQKKEEPIKTYLMYVNEETETKKFTIKDLVADAFLSNKPEPISRKAQDEIVAGFLDCNKFNCHYSNLCWTTRGEYNQKLGLRFDEAEGTLNKGIDGWTYLENIPDGYFYMYPTEYKHTNWIDRLHGINEWKIKLKDSTSQLDYSKAKNQSPFNELIEQYLQNS
jgi:hypothetical protein